MWSASSLSEGKPLCSGFRLGRLLGRGASGEVWEAGAPDGRTVALKFLDCRGSSAAAEELRSTLAVRRLSHPGLVKVDQVWCDRGHLVLTMEVADGSLQDVLELSLGEYGGPPPARRVWADLAQAAEALDFLNARRHPIAGRPAGIQHCDVKPSNLLVFGDAVKLCDFGLSSVLAGSAAPHRRAGTPSYAAPEVFRGRLSDRTDQYALAVTYCQLRGGRLPFPDTPGRFRSDYARPEPDLTMLAEGERPAVARALSRAPEARWPTCAAMMDELARALPREGAQRRGVARHPCPHRPPCGC